MRLRYDSAQNRLLAGGLDNIVKFFDVQNSQDLTVQYQLKVPSEIFAMDFSSDGNHYSLGLNDGTLIIKSKQIEEQEEEESE